MLHVCRGFEYVGEGLRKVGKCRSIMAVHCLGLVTMRSKFAALCTRDRDNLLLPEVCHLALSRRNGTRLASTEEGIDRGQNAIRSSLSLDHPSSLCCA